MTKIRVAAKVHLPHDANGVSAQPGQILEVDTDAPGIRGYIEHGLLYPVDPLDFPGELKPPVAPSVADAGDDAAADGAAVGPIPDAPQHAAQAPDTGEPARGLLPPYEENTMDVLRAEIDARGLDAPSDARKADLVAALEADDASR